MRLINYSSDTKYTNESCWRIFKTNRIQQNNLSPNSYPDIQDRRSIFPMGYDPRTPRSSLCDTCRSWRHSHRNNGNPFCYLLWKGYSWSKYAIVVWSVLGIADLVNAITLGQITSSGPTISTMLNFPLILFPTMPVLAALVLHLITLYRLRSYVPIQEHIKLSSKNASFAEKEEA